MEIVNHISQEDSLICNLSQGDSSICHLCQGDSNKNIRIISRLTGYKKRLDSMESQRRLREKKII